ncbi:glutamate receptor ionotropic, NMDA 2B-like [Hydractinia symbiolongicarpus]|uniref:glutamate receptor ionotropic, NMDA 2B-like n=1 Tax=Hydractinia symbiolongicarpus TaxID=13093 RepID=UPI002551234E|nr:glutamate receptor ionotropic, NMDA 2B-like [Hydractinia symbiolongicarpus]
MKFSITFATILVFINCQLSVMSSHFYSDNSLSAILQKFHTIRDNNDSTSTVLETKKDEESKILNLYQKHIGGILLNTTISDNNVCIIPILQRYFNLNVLLVLDKGNNQHIQTYFQNQSIYNTYDFDKRINNTNLAKDVYTWKASGFKMFILLCSLQCNLALMNMAITAEMLDKGFVWITSQKELGILEADHPAHIFYVDLNLNGNSLTPGCDFISDFNKFRIKGEKLISYHTEKSRLLPELFALNQLRWILLTRTERLSTIIDFAESKKQGNKKAIIKTVTIIEPPFIVFAPHFPDKYSDKCEVGKICWEYQFRNHSKVRVPRCCNGLCIELLDLIELEIDISTDLYIVEDGAYGTELNGTYNGLVGDLLKGKAELILAPLTMYATRAERIAFSEPFRLNGVAIATMAQKIEYSFFSLEVFSPLTAQLWSVTFLTALFASIILSYIEYCLHEKKRFYPWSESILYHIGLVFQRDMGGQNPTHVSTRVVGISVAIFMMILMSSYTAILTANKVMNPYFFPIKGLKDERVTNPSSEFKFGTLKNSGISQMFRDSNKPEWRSMYNHMKEFNFIDTVKALDDLRAGKLDAIIHDAAVLKYYSNKDVQCNIHMVGEIIPDGGYAFAAAKESALLRGITRSIRKYKSKGMLERLDKRWFHNNCGTGKKTDHIEQADIYSFGGLFVVMVAGILFSFVLFIMEYMWLKVKKAKITNKVMQMQGS